MTILWGMLGFLAVVLAVLSIVDVVRRHLGAGTTTLWIVVIVVLPLLGSLIYWAMRQRGPADVEAYAASDRELREQARRRSVDSTGLGP